MQHEPSLLIRQILALEAEFHTAAPIPHVVCVAGDCVMQGGKHGIYVCSRNSKIVHVCNMDCNYAVPAEDDTLICSLTGALIVDNASAPPNYQAPSRPVVSANYGESNVVVVSQILGLIREAVLINRHRAVEHAVKAAFDSIPCPPTLHEYAAIDASFKSKAYPAFDAAMTSFINLIPSLSVCIARLWHAVSKARPTQRKLTFFTIICFFFFKSGRLVPKIFRRIPALDIAHSKLAVVTYIQSKQDAHQWAPQSITDRQNKYQAAFLSSLDQDELVTIVASTLPASAFTDPGIGYS